MPFITAVPAGFNNKPYLVCIISIRSPFQAVSHERISNKAAHHSTAATLVHVPVYSTSAERASTKTPWYTRNGKRRLIRNVSK